MVPPSSSAERDERIPGKDACPPLVRTGEVIDRPEAEEHRRVGFARDVHQLLDELQPLDIVAEPREMTSPTTSARAHVQNSAFDGVGPWLDDGAVRVGGGYLSAEHLGDAPCLRAVCTLDLICRHGGNQPSLTRHSTSNALGKRVLFQQVQSVPR